MGGFLDRQRFRQDHRWAPKRMSDYLDGELATSGRRRMERHLAGCEECRRLLEGLRRTIEGLHRLSAHGGAGDAAAIAASVRARLGEYR
jgi:anti-sigma factor RsiW